MKYVENLISQAINSREKAYAPYSNFKVGAALLTTEGEIYGGFNIECASYPICNCAERTALFRAIFDGKRNFKAIAIVGGKAGQAPSSYCPPCGMCRQALREFCSADEFEIILAKNTQDFKIFKLKDLLPESFGPENL